MYNPIYKLYLYKSGVSTLEKRLKKNKIEFENENIDDLDIYSEEIMEVMLEDDEISDAESGFMHGYMQEDSE